LCGKSKKLNNKWDTSGSGIKLFVVTT
jgi:hypothetical protein